MPISINNTTLTFNNGTTMTTAATGTVSSVATGNGLQGGTITTSGTLSVACPAFNTVGSYCFVARQTTVNPGTNYADLQCACMRSDSSGNAVIRLQASQISGTWKWMGAASEGDQPYATVGCRVS